jgi:carbamate kinase
MGARCLKPSLPASSGISMGPRIEAAMRFIRGGGKRAVITFIERIEAAMAGEADTEIVG